MFPRPLEAAVTAEVSELVQPEPVIVMRLDRE